MSFRYPKREQVLRVHQSTLELHGGSSGLADDGLLDAALAIPLSTFDGHLLHPTIAEAAAAYLFHLCANHPFVDGNKRVAAIVAITFLETNGYRCSASNEELEEITLLVASGQMPKSQLIVWFQQVTEPEA